MTQTPTDAVATAPTVRITTAKGDIVIRLYPEETPQTAANFLELAGSGFYDGLTFHRVESSSGFQLIQGGCPKGTGAGGGPKTVVREISPKLTHIEGAVGLARSQHPDSGSCQFYICNCAIHALDGGYAVFGQVIEGLDVAKRIVPGDKMLKVTVADITSS
jgi:peptidyl-prolyl cis-trans isomerase B (cyclophilin B)